MCETTKLFSSNHGFKCFWTIEDFTRCRSSTDLILRSSNFKVNILFKSEWFIAIQMLNERFNVFLCKSKGNFDNCVNYSVHLLTSNGWDIKSEGFNKFLKNDDGYSVEFKYDVIFRESLTMCVHLWSGATRGQNAQCVMTSEMLDEREILNFPFQKLPAITLEDLIFPAFNNSKQVQNVKASENIKTSNENSNLLSGFAELLKLFGTPKVTASDKGIQTETTDILNDFEDLSCLSLHLFKKKKFSYVFLRTETKEFAAHNALLSAQSPVFHAMFDEDKAENDSKIFDIVGIDNETLSLLLQFLHLRPLPSLKWKSAAKLFLAADKYQIQKLKKKCISILNSGLTEENVCDAYMFADLHHDNELMQNVLKYLSKNYKIVLSSSEWKDFIRTETELASEIILKINENFINCKS